MASTLTFLCILVLHLVLNTVNMNVVSCLFCCSNVRISEALMQKQWRRRNVSHYWQYVKWVLTCYFLIERQPRYYTNLWLIVILRAHSSICPITYPTCGKTPKLALAPPSPNPATKSPNLPNTNPNTSSSSLFNTKLLTNKKYKL